MTYAPLTREPKPNHAPGRKPATGKSLRLSSPSDPLEQEADRIAARVLSTPPDAARTPAIAPVYSPPKAHDAALVRRKCAACEHDDERTVHRKCSACEHDDELAVRRSPSARGSREISPALQDHVMNLHRGGGRPLPQPVRMDMESRFGRDFGAVRIHEGTRAAELAQRLHAKAFTVGQHVAFAGGQFAPTRPEGRRLLAHELVHTLQRSDPGAPVLSRALASPQVEDEASEWNGIRGEQSGKVVGCRASKGRPPGAVMRAHELAVQMTTKAHNALPAAPDLEVRGAIRVQPRVRELARLWFQLEWPARDLVERADWHHMLNGVRALYSGGPSTLYKCSTCNQSGLVLPGSRFVRLCDGWWQKLLPLHKRAAIIIHEWGHFWGGRAGLMRRMAESYCGRKRFNAMPASRLVQMPDAYMGFIYELALNMPLTAGWLCSPNPQIQPGDD